MERCLRAVVVMCLSVLLASNGAVADEKTSDEIADNNACTYFSVIDNNDDGYATYFDYLCLWLRLPLIGKRNQLYRDIERQMVILKQFADQFPLTDKDFVESLLEGGVSLDEYLDAVRLKRYQPVFKQQIHSFVDLFYNILTYDDDPSAIDLDEFKLLYSVWNVSGAETSFSKLDVDDDGKITLDEAYSAAEDYFITATDPLRSAYLIGPPRTCEEVRRRVSIWVDPIAHRKLVLRLEDYGRTTALIKLLLRVPGLSDLLPNLLEELLGRVINLGR